MRKRIRCLDLADFLLIAEEVTGVSVEVLMRLPRLHYAEHALAAPTAGLGEVFYYPTFAEKAAAMTFQLIKGHSLIDGNKRVGYMCLREFVAKNGYDWVRPPADGVERLETVRTIEGVADGNVSQRQLADWIQLRIVERTPDDV